MGGGGGVGGGREDTRVRGEEEGRMRGDQSQFCEEGRQQRGGGLFHTAVREQFKGTLISYIQACSHLSMQRHLLLLQGLKLAADA